VLSASGEIAERCSSSFRKDEIRVVTAHNAGELARLPAELPIALVDASDLPKASPRAIASSLASVPLVLVWGTDVDAAKAMLAALEREGVRIMGFTADQSVDPIIDVLRARLAG
jgi:hypothetical protein